MVGEAAKHGKGGLVWIAVVIWASARLFEAVLFVKGDSSLVGFSDFEENGFDSAAVTFGKSGVQQNGRTAFSPPVWTDCEIEKFHLFRGGDRSKGQETEEDLAVPNHPAADVSHLEFEFARSPLRSFGARLCEQQHFWQIGNRQPPNIFSRAGGAHVPAAFLPNISASERRI